MSRASRRIRTKQKAVDEALAAKLYDGHQRMLDHGYRFMSSSRLWQRRDKSLTVRLVYRHTNPKVEFLETMVCTFRIYGGAL